jgi:hypothetical protein
MDWIEKIPLLALLAGVAMLFYFAARNPLKTWRNLEGWKYKYPALHEPSRSALDMSRIAAIFAILVCAIGAVFVAEAPSREQVRLEKQRREEWQRESIEQMSRVVRQSKQDTLDRIPSLNRPKPDRPGTITIHAPGTKPPAQPR